MHVGIILRTWIRAHENISKGRLGNAFRTEFRNPDSESIANSLFLTPGQIFYVYRFSDLFQIRILFEFQFSSLYLISQIHTYFV